MLREVAYEKGVDEETYNKAMDLRKMAQGRVNGGGLGGRSLRGDQVFAPGASWRQRSRQWDGGARSR